MTFYHSLTQEDKAIWLAVTSYACLIAFVIALKARWSSAHLSLPPGPKGYPIIGNLLDIPLSNFWIYLTELRSDFGGFVYLSVFGRPVLVLNSYDAALDLLVKRASIYSHRPIFVMGDEFMELPKSVAMAPYGEYHRTHRRLADKYLGTASLINEFSSNFERESAEFIRTIHKDATDYVQDARYVQTKIIVELIYGIRITSKTDPLFAVPKTVVADIAATFAPGAYLVELIPTLKYVPTWFPGAGWKRYAIHLGDKLKSVIMTAPYLIVKENLEKGNARPSFTSRLIQDEYKLGPSGADDVSKSWLSGTLYGASLDSTVTSMTRFIYLMMRNPEIQKRAQAEIDSVLGLPGQSRLPKLTDRDKFEYLWACIKETHRLWPQFPMSLPHRLIQEDEYRGFRIPKDTTVLQNTWAILHDPEIYPDPYTFNPDRFMTPNPPLDPHLVSFGLGRRTCIGRHVASSVIFITAATLLVTTDILPPLDENGKEYIPEPEFEGTIITELKQFPARFIPRTGVDHILG